MDAQVHILLKVLDFMVYIFPRIIPALVMCNIFLEMGLMKKLMPLGRSFTKVAHLPAVVSLPFISSFGSAYVGGAIVVDLFDRKLLDDRQALLSSMALSIPVFFREFVSYYLPTVISILGWTLGCIYMGVHVTVIGTKALFVILMGRRSPPCDWSDDEPGDIEETKTSLRGAVQNGVLDSIRPLKRMAMTIPLSALVIFELEALGLFDYSTTMAGKIGFSLCAVPAIVSYIAHPMAGLSMLAVLYHEGDIMLIEAVKAMLLGSLFHLPVIILRTSGTYYIGVDGPRLGVKLAALSSGITTFVYGTCLLLIISFQYWR
jgi:hypothetical protein